ncbi:hypothetical protein AGLY_005104 [Aphis glycines]|uniref:Uncharacterized protein n=1 Tax=Aphis glycines TaxID=307491 RepID=A0A6G0TVU6_APHGL|nr:hypothetical protein AGLY_005104 [Aphis glycines]
MSNTISENETLSSSSAVQISDEPNEMKLENGQLETVSTSQNVSATTMKRLYGSLPNLTSTALTTAGNESDTAAILQESTAVTVQPVSIEPIAFGATQIKSENNAELRNHELSNINTSENETLSSSPAVPITDEPISMKSENGQLETVSTSQNVSATTTKRPYGSLPNLTSTALTTAGNEGDTAVILQEPTVVTVQPVSVEPIAFGPTPIKSENNAGLQNHELPTAEVEIQSPSVSLDRLQVSAVISNRDGSGESGPKSRDHAGLQKRLWKSMPNIALHYTDKAFYDTKIECTVPMKVARNSSTRSSTTVTEPEVIQVKLKRCSLWKRTKKFARRVFCCAA